MLEHLIALWIFSFLPMLRCQRDVPNDLCQLPWIAIVWRLGFLANDYVDGARERGVLLPTIIWMARTWGSLANIPNEYKCGWRKHVVLLPARTWDSLANVLNTTRTDASSSMWSPLRERTQVHIRGAHYEKGPQFTYMYMRLFSQRSQCTLRRLCR